MDYDIDKAYIMGLNFDTNGKYIGWSELFDYSSIDTLNASEYLPMPLKVKHLVVNNVAKLQQDLLTLLSKASTEEEKTELQNKLTHLQNNHINIDSWISKIINESDKVKKIHYYADLINNINKHAYREGDSKKVYISYTNANGKEIENNLRRHEFTLIPVIYSQEMNKNFISSHIQNTVQDLDNVTRAYSPIEMELFRDASLLSPKQNEMGGLTLLNPATKLIMLYINMTGKNVIGTSANGEKGSFMWHYYLNDLIREGNEQKRKFGHFSITLNRIVGRAENNIQSVTLTGLPDLNLDGIDPKIAAEFNGRITGNLYVDLMISQVLSAATDSRV